MKLKKRYILNRNGIVNLICLLIVTILIFGCSSSEKEISQILKSTELLIEENPDSALNLLESLKFKNNWKSQYKAQYNLLRTQAHVKLNYENVDTSKINSSFEYYRQSNDNIHYMKAAFYKAYLKSEYGEYPESMRLALLCFDMAEEMHDYYWMAKSTELIGDLYSDSFNAEEELSSRIKSTDYYLKAGKIRNHRFGLVDLAKAYIDNGEFDSAKVLLDSVIQISNASPVDSTLSVYCYEAYLDLNYWQHDSIQFLKNSKILRNFTPFYTPSIQNITREANFNYYKGDIKALKDNLLDIDTLGIDDRNRALVLLSLSYYYKITGNYKKAINLLDSAFYCRDRVLENAIWNSALGVERDYYYIKNEREKEHSKFLSVILVLSGFIFIVVIVTTWIIHNLRIKAKDLELENKFNDLLRMSAEIEAKQTENLNLENKLKNKEIHISGLEKTQEEEINKRYMLETKLYNMFRDQWKFLNIMCKEYFEKQDSPTVRTSIIKEIEHEITKLKSASSLREIENAVNEYNGNIAARLREQCTWMKEDDKIFVILNYAGFSARTICLFRNLGFKNYYMKRERLYAKILASDASDAPEFARELKRGAQ